MIETEADCDASAPSAARQIGTSIDASISQCEENVGAAPV
jgi:hypothetical protein